MFIQDTIRKEYGRILEKEITKAFIHGYKEQAESFFRGIEFCCKGFEIPLKPVIVQQFPDRHMIPFVEILIFIRVHGIRAQIPGFNDFFKIESHFILVMSPVESYQQREIVAFFFTQVKEIN